MTKTIYIVHGWAYTVDAWEETLVQLKKMDINPVMLHVPGLTDPSDKVWSIDDYVEWLNEGLRGANDPIVLGHSNGGRIALNYVIKYPNKLKHLILLNSAGVYENPNYVSGKRKILYIAAKLGRPLRRISVFRKIIYRIIGASDYENAPQNMKETLQNMLSSDKILDKNLQETGIKTPTSILWGSGDVLTPPEQGKKLHSLIRGSTLDIFDSWRHAPYRTHPKQLASEVHKILESI